MARVDPVVHSLNALQALLRRPPSDGEQAALTKQIPPDLTGGEEQGIGMLADEVAAMRLAVESVSANPEMEHLRNPEEEVWRFVSECYLDRAADHVDDFVVRHRREADERVCFIPVEHLSVETPLTLHGITLLPLQHNDVPPEDRPWFDLQPPVGCVAAVTARGTSPSQMATRARALAKHEMRVLRIALREHHAIHDRQLRFRVGTTYSFAGQQAGFAQREEVAYELTIDDDLLRLAETQAVSGLPLEATGDVERKAHLAVRWMERAWLAGDRLVALLYLFFALEALLGDKSEKLKAHDLAFRQMTLSHVAEGHFFHPNETWLLYDRVRSGAVHGEDPPEIDDRVVSDLTWSVRKSLDQYLRVAAEQGFTRRGRLLRYLNEHAEQPQLIAWLRANGGSIWSAYLDALEGGDPQAPRSGG